MSVPNDAAHATTSERFATLFPDLSETTVAKLACFKSELIKAGSNSSLIAASALANLDTIHFADSVKAGGIIFSQAIPSVPLYDFGSGNGFPGLVLAILHPEREFVLVEKDSRRTDALKQIIFALALSNTKVIASNVEDLPAGSVKLAIARGFGVLSKSMIATRKVMDVGGIVFYMKGDNWPQELAAVPSQLFTYWDAAVVATYRIPETETDISIISTKKIAN